MWEPDVRLARRSVTTFSPRGRRFSADALPELSVEAKDRIIRTLVRRNRGVAYNGRAYELLWVLILARICKLLTRVAELVHYRHAPQDLMTAIGLGMTWKRSKPAEKRRRGRRLCYAKWTFTALPQGPRPQSEGRPVRGKRMRRAGWCRYWDDAYAAKDDVDGSWADEHWIGRLSMSDDSSIVDPKLGGLHPD